MRRVVLYLLLALPVYAGKPLDVPFIAQQSGYCGPAALAMLAGFYEQPVSQAAIASAIYLPDIHGTLTADLADYAKQFNLWTRQYHGTTTDIRQKLTAGVPVIVLGKFGNKLHFFVVLGFDEFAGTVLVHSDQQAGLVMPQEQFWRVWDRADRWTLLICPPDKATWTLTGDEYNDLGVFLEQTGNLPAAAGNYRRATELVPANSYFQMNLGNVLLKQKLLPEAVVAFRQAVQCEPGNA
ncbi:MAG: cysteine peptidase family C39 domain-containing protein, partial [Verrucomicrobiota bacterium]